MELLDTSANPLQLHRQAKKILRNTSRATNPDWYKRANDLDFQWHIWIGVGRVISTIYNRATNEWFEGPELPRLSFEESGEVPGQIDDLDELSRNALHELVRGILASKEYGSKPKSLGIVMHLADGIRVRDLDPQFAAEKDFDSVNELLLSAPDIALGDDSAAGEEGQWRILPLFGKKDTDKLAIAAQVSSNFQFIANAFLHYGEMRNIPVVAEVISAALEGLAGLPELLSGAGRLENTLTLLQFEAFTLLCATGKHGALEMVRPLPHRSDNCLNATEIADYISQTAALLNFKNPRVALVSMAGMEEGRLNSLLQIFKESNPDSELLAIDSTKLPYAESIPGQRFEFAFSTGNCDIEIDQETLIFEARKKWATQDFNGDSAEERKKMPTRGDLRMLKFAGIAQKLAIVAILGFGGWTGTEYLSKLKSEAWKLDETAASEMNLKLAELQKERNEWDYYENLFVKRSEGWLAMEALLGIFPEKGGVILKSASYAASGGDPERGADTYGINRNWKIVGYANPEVAKNLSSLGSKTMVAELLDRIAEENDADYLGVNSATRRISVNLDQKRGTMPSSKAFPTRIARYFRTAFDLSISHTLDAKDELALNLEKSKSE